MNKLKTLAIAGLVVAGFVGAASAVNVNKVSALAEYPRCGNDIKLHGNYVKPKWSRNGNTMSVTFTMPKECSGKGYKITLVSYVAPTCDTSIYKDQQRYREVSDIYDTKYGSDRTVTRSVALPPVGGFQVDLVIGNSVQTFPPAPGYPNGEPIYGHEHRLLGATGGCNAPAPAPAPAPTPPAPAPAPAPAAPAQSCVNNSCNVDNSTTVNGNGNNVCNTNTTTSSAATGGSTVNNNTGGNSTTCTNNSTNTTTPPTATQTNVVTREVVSDKETPSSGKLPDTGPGVLAGLGFGTTFMSTLAYAYRGRYTDIVARLIARF